MNIIKSIFLTLACITVLTGCSKDENSEELSTDELSAINGEEGTELNITKNNVTINSYGKNVIEFQGVSAFSPENTVRNLRILSDDYSTLNLWYVLGKDEDFIKKVQGIQRLQSSSLELTEASYQSEIYAECYPNDNSDSRNHLSGTIEIKKDVLYLGVLYKIVGILDLYDDDTKITGVFWKKHVPNW